MITIVNDERDSVTRTAALRVIRKEVRQFNFTATNPQPVKGEVTHYEAKGLVAIESVPVPMNRDVCERSTHRHIPGEPIGIPSNLCIIPELYPVTMHLDLPVGDSCGPFLGDNFIVTIRRAEGEIEHQYVTGERSDDGERLRDARAIPDYSPDRSPDH